MVIANPIYDVVFKKLMENEKVAKFFIGTLLDQNIESVEVKPQEYTYIESMDMNDPVVRKTLEETVMERISIRVYRLDFVATIRTETGELKKVLIEIQKANNPVDLMRFRNYLAEQYKKEDLFNNSRVILPITTIYILGFNLPEIETPCLKVERNYSDLINKTTITTKSDFVEKLSHDCFIVQVERITNRYKTRLDQLLSIFEQTNFVGDKKIIKEFNHEPEGDELKTIIDILHHSGTNPKEKKELEDEQEAWRTIDALTGDLREKEKMYLKVIEENAKTIAESEKVLAEHEKALAENEKALAENEKALAEQNQALAEQNQALAEQNQALADSEKALSEKDKLISELMKKLNEQK